MGLKMSKYVLVDVVDSFRVRYVMELHEDDPDEYALDSIICNEATQFSQEHLGEHIVSHRQITEDEFIEICDEDNSYLKSWDRQKKIDNFVTKMVE